MLPIYLFLAALLVAPSAARGQEAEPESAPTQAEPAAPAPARIAIPRGSRPQGDNPRIGTAHADAAVRPAARSVEAPPAHAGGSAGSIGERTGTVCARTGTAGRSARNAGRRVIARGLARRSRDRSAPPRSDGRITTDRGRTVVVPNRSRTVIRPATEHLWLLLSTRVLPVGSGRTDTIAVRIWRVRPRLLLLQPIQVVFRLRARLLDLWLLRRLPTAVQLV